MASNINERSLTVLKDNVGLRWNLLDGSLISISNQSVKEIIVYPENQLDLLRLQCSNLFEKNFDRLTNVSTAILDLYIVDSIYESNRINRPLRIMNYNGN